jgi:hypothetical protein
VGKFVTKVWKVYDQDTGVTVNVSDSLYIDEELEDYFSRHLGPFIGVENKEAYYRIHVSSRGGLDRDVIKLFKNGCKSTEVRYFRDNLVRLINDKESVQREVYTKAENAFVFRIDSELSDYPDKKAFHQSVIKEFDSILERSNIQKSSLNENIYQGEFLPRYDDVLKLWESMYTKLRADEFNLFLFDNMLNKSSIDQRSLDFNYHDYDRLDFRIYNSFKWVEIFGRTSEIKELKINFDNFKFTGSGKDLLLYVLLDFGRIPRDDKVLSKLYDVKPKTYDEAVAILSE